jgi:Asp-tRNA(Asn)/Glu-tRNA(Gln) amidotransferase A subunit family amidase
VGDIDVLIAPVVSAEPPSVERAVHEHRAGPTREFETYLDETTWVNALGWPALSLQTEHGPRQIIARPGREAAILAVARSILNDQGPP